jgi:hypothetical protein
MPVVLRVICTARGRKVAREPGIPGGWHESNTSRGLFGVLLVGAIVEQVALIVLTGLAGLALAAFGFLGAEVGGEVGVVGEEAGAVLVGARLVDGEGGGDFVLEAQLPGVGALGVVAPEAAVGDGEGGVGAALVVDAPGEVAGGEVRPVVVLAARGGGELLPPLLISPGPPRKVTHAFRGCR